MKNIAAILVFLLAGFLSSRYLGLWWDIAVIGFLISLVFGLSPAGGFGILFIGGLLLWGGITWGANVQSESTLLGDLAGVFNIENKPLFVLLIASLGGLLAGLSGWSGALLNRLMRRKKG